MEKPRRIAVVTATRAEYGLLSCLLRELKAAPDVELQLIVTGAHLSVHHGQTENQILADGFAIDARIPIPLEEDTPRAITKSLGLATIGFADTLAKLAPDILVLLGDRWETLAAAEAALIARVPVAHIHGGESTEGAIDEAIRHSITKMAHLHFVAARPYRDRVIQLGEAPDRVWVVGAVGLDLIFGLAPLDRDSLEASLGIRFGKPSFLVTYHPETLNGDDDARKMRTILEVLDETGGTVIVTGVNADPNGSLLRAEAERFVAKHHDRFAIFTSLGSERYLSVMRQVDAVVGNSSSGLLEAPAIGVPTVNIGNRQRGRLSAPSVLDCDATKPSLRATIGIALSSAHKAVSARCDTPYGTRGAAQRIASILRSYNLSNLLMKKFYDIPKNNNIDM